MTITQFTLDDVHSYSYRSVLSHGAVFIDGFRNDYFLSTLEPSYFGLNATLPLKQRQKHLNRFGRVFGRKALLAVASGNSYLCNAIEDGEAMATCLVNYPEDQRPKLTIWQILKYGYYVAYICIANLLDGNPEGKIMTPRVRNFFIDMVKLTGGIQPQEYYHKLSEMSHEELENALYPLDKTLYVHILSVTSKGQGRGYGGRLLLYSLSVFKEREQIFNGSYAHSIGPVKASLYPSRGNDSFYRRYGSEPVFEGEPCKLTDQDSYTFTFMQKVL